MPIKLKFLDWTRPALISAAEYLIAGHAAGPEVNLSELVVVLPGSRSGRRMLEILVQLAEQRGLALLPPKFITVGGLPELLYRPQKRFATDLEQQLAWSQALQQHDRQELTRIVRQLPEPTDVPAWLDLAGLLHRLHRELATDLLSFDDVVRLGMAVEGFAEEARWTILSAIRERYLRTLDALELWDVQTARIEALRRKECATERQIVLVGTVDLNEALRKMLDQVEEQTPGRITALVFASPELHERFDSHGCVVAAAWQDALLEISETALASAENAAEQAESVVRTIAGYEGRYRADEITVGVADERISPQVERILAQCNLPSRWGPGKPLPHTAPYRLLAAIGDYHQSGRFAAFAALVRHPDVSRWLGTEKVRDEWLTQLDKYYNEHLPVRLGVEWLGEEHRFDALRAAYEAITRLLLPLGSLLVPREESPPLAEREGYRRLHEWAGPLIDLLNSIYGWQTVDRDDQAGRSLLATCGKLAEAIGGLAELDPRLAPPVSADVALKLALNLAAGETIPPPSDEEAIELLGWLELPLDDAPALIVTSFNEGFVPKAVNSDLFLPNALRAKLQLEDNARRYARDAYALSVLVASRRELKLIVARRDTEKSPLMPSRLLFATDGATVARRALRFFEPSPPVAGRVPLAGAWVAYRERSDFLIPPPRPLDKPLESLSVTQFRAYLACPYRFYLGRVLRLEAIDDAAEELDGGSFGNVMHAVFERFGNNLEKRDSTDSQEIAKFLQDELTACVAATFGRRPAAAIAIQAEQMRDRLEAFAKIQAARAAQGWRIEFVEPAGLAWPLEVDGRPFVLTGRIDRIDRHETTGKRAILDYKTSDSGAEPRKTHLKKGDWIDLQLPLYCHLAKCLKLTGPFDLGYIALPKDVSKTAFVMAEWDATELTAADETAYDVIRAIRNEVFRPLTEPPPPFSEEFAPICQDGVFEKARLA